VLKGHLAVFIEFDKFFVNAKGRGSGGQSKDKGSVAIGLGIIDALGNVLSGKFAHLIVVVHNDHSHGNISFYVF
jgi:hypothetical protein